MGVRGPKAKPVRSVKTSVRLSFGVRTKLAAAAAKKGKKLSSEIETRPVRSFADDFSVVDEFGNLQIMALARTAFAAARATVSRGIGTNEPPPKVTPPQPAVSWLNDPAAYAAAVAAINKVLELLRPTGDAVVLDTEPTYKPAFNAQELVREIATAPLAPPARASRQLLATNELRHHLGDALLDRAGGAKARARAEWGKEFAALRRKKTKTVEDIERMNVLADEAEG